MFKLKASAPTRVDLAGGTLDIAPLHFLFDRCATVNVSVSLRAFIDFELNTKAERHISVISEDQGLDIQGVYEDIVKSEKLPLVARFVAAIWSSHFPGFKLKLKATCPAGAGLGGSSSLALTLSSILFAARKELGGGGCPNDRRLVEYVQNLEIALIRTPTGCQDYWGALNGGLSLIEFQASGTEVSRLPIESLETLWPNMILVYSGKSRASATNNWQIFQQAFAGDKKVLSLLKELSHCSLLMIEAVQNGRADQILELSRNDWDIRKELWSDVECAETKAIDQAAREAGARFSRVCGAGGGGMMGIFVDKEKQLSVTEAVTRVGGRVMAAGATNCGLVIAKELL